MSDVGQRYFCPPGYVIRDEMVECEFERKDGTKVWRFVRITQVADRPIDKREDD